MPPVRALVTALVLASPTSCSDDGVAPTTDASTSADAGTSGAPDSSSGGPTPTSTGDASTGDASTTAGSADPSSGTTDPGFDPPVPMCGNGFVEADEECDDGNVDDGDACSSACEVPCGLELEVLELAPTAQSNIDGVQVARGKDGGFVVLAALREITVDMEMNSTIGPRQMLVLAYDAAGEKRWETKLAPMMGDAEAEGLAIDEAGDIAVIGSVDGADLSDIWVLKLKDADEGEVAWQRTVDGALMGSEDFGTSVAIAPGGDIIAAGQIRDGDKDANVWVRKYEGPTGDTIWTTTWSGEAESSVDAAGQVAVGADGSIYVAAREYISSDVTEATLLKFGPGGGAPLWTVTPLASPDKHKNSGGPVAVGPDGEVLFGVRKAAPGPAFWVYRYGPDGGAPTWSHPQEDFEIGGQAWELAGLDFFPDGGILVGGDWYNDFTIADLGWYEVWSARLDADGVKQCQTSFRAAGEDLAPPTVVATSFAAGAEGLGLATGTRIESEEASMWAGVFRPL